MNSPSDLYAVVAEFGDADRLLAAVKKARREYRDVDAYTPYAVDGLAEALGFRRTRIPSATFVGGAIGGAIGFLLQWYSAAIDYPINSGGRPLVSWPAFIPVTFEVAVLGAALAAFFGMLVLNGLPRLRHPIFNAPEFDLASRNRFFMSVRASDPQFDLKQTREFLKTLSPLSVMDVEATP